MDHGNHHHSQHSEHSYRMLAVMTVLHFVFMYGMSYLMVDTGNDIFFNLNSLYMALWMVAPSVVLMLVLMKSMYPNRKLNMVIHVVSVLVFVLSFVFIRNQSFVGDEQFAKSMIPHHSGAILMCQKANITDSELKTLCSNISTGQRKEIDQLNAILNRIK